LKETAYKYSKDDLKKIWHDTISFLCSNTSKPMPEIPSDTYYEQLLKKEKLWYEI
jgi:hypothetical protein